MEIEELKEENVWRKNLLKQFPDFKSFRKFKEEFWNTAMQARTNDIVTLIESMQGIGLHGNLIDKNDLLEKIRLAWPEAEK